MSESEIQYVMRTEHVSRYYAIKILEVLDKDMIKNNLVSTTSDEFKRYVDGPIDPRD